MTDQQEEKLAQDLTVKAVEDVFDIIEKATNKLMEADAHPHMAFQLIRAVGFAVCGSSLAFFPGDQARKEAAAKLIKDFSENVAMGVAMNEGMENHKSSSIILQ